MTTSEPTPDTAGRGRHADPADPEETAAPAPGTGASAATAEAKPSRLRRGAPVGRHPAGGSLLLSSGLLLGLFLAPAVLGRLDFALTDRATAAARSAATRWPGGGEPWFWPNWVALLAGVVAVVLVAVALTGVRLPDVVVAGFGIVLAGATAWAAWATLDVVDARIWDLLPVCAICLTAFGLALSGLAHWRSPADGDPGSGAGGAATAVLAGLGLALLLLLGGATVAHVQAEGLGPAGPPQDVAGLLTVRADDAAAADDLAGPWVPQLEAARIADDDAATAYSARHRARAGLLPVLLVRGDDVTGAGLDDSWWLSVAAEGFASEAEAQQWCSTAGLGPPQCVPQQLDD
ncbi:hypothetical protein [Blastococcus sp. SYSU DS0617]